MERLALHKDIACKQMAATLQPLSGMAWKEWRGNNFAKGRTSGSAGHPLCVERVVSQGWNIHGLMGQVMTVLAG